MQDMLTLAGANLLTPMILCFALGLFAALARSELTIPEAVAKGMSIYLLFAIGFKGGVAVADHGLDARLIAALVAGVVLSFLIPFVAFALLSVVGITLLMQFVGLSAALGTFLAGVVLAESEYRHELEMDLDPFKGLLLAVFFMAVGAGIDFSLLASQPLTIAGLVLGFVAIKLAVLYGLGRAFRMSLPDASRFSFSLAQGGEFAFVLISFAAGLGLLAATQSGMLVAAVAISMALAPLLMLLDENVLQPRFVKNGNTREADIIDGGGARVIIAGHGRYGMTVNRLLGASGNIVALFSR